MMIFLICAIILIVIIGFVVLLKSGNNILINLKHEAWNKLDENLGTDFCKDTQIVINSREYHKKSNSYIPSTVISLDTKHRTMAVTKIIGEEKNEKGVIVKYNLGSDYIPFSSVMSGELVLGGRKSSAINSNLGSVSGNGVLTTIGTSNTYNEVAYIHYILKLNDISNPLYTIVIRDTSVVETAPIYKTYIETANKIDAVIRNIISQNQTGISTDTASVSR